ncbi:Homeotic protein caudal-like protein [Dinothrombium tinctorium]|uniref:Homeotic protein caudal-like protein n=1 Tax=Dinothrombium tinctorium TaxID=1965070 RepID=A0A3S3RZ36_9ACAR|nr:Homeotic protein caudal-like protein [Dinothrombium tinctorium]
MSTVQPQCKLAANNEFGVHQYYGSHAHQPLVPAAETGQKIGSNILSIATSGILDSNIFQPNKDTNASSLQVIESNSVADKLMPHYAGGGSEFLPQAYPASHQPTSWYHNASPGRTSHFHNQMANVNASNTSFTDSWAAAAAAAAATTMVNVIPHCNYSLSSPSVYGSVNSHRQSHQPVQYSDRTYQYPYNVGSSYLPNSGEPINAIPASPDVQITRTNLEPEVNSGEVSEEKPQIASSGEEIDKSDDEALACGGTSGFTNRPQPARSPFEWMKKPSYQNQSTNNGKTRTRDKYRVVYSDHQRLELEKEFHYSRYITIRRKSELASMLGLSERQNKDQNSHIHNHHLLIGGYNPQSDGQLAIAPPNGAY